MTANELRKKYLKFFESKGHKVIPSAPLVPENDSSTLFISAGMHPLVPYLLGQSHPEGKRLADVQKTLRTDDIDEVGDYCHHTFFEMLGNWSLGDYFKKDAIEWSLEFLTSPTGLGYDKNKLAFSVFQGDSDAPFDEESYQKWLALGIPEQRIARLPKKNNWWETGAPTGPCGPDTEMFYWTDSTPTPSIFDPEDTRWVEIWNDVFMEYNKTPQGYKKLSQQNVDTGFGLERNLAIVNNLYDDYQTELFLPVIQKIESLSNLEYGDKSDSEYIEEGKQCWVDVRKRFRVIADHIRAAVFVIADKVEPSNKDRGYILRRLIRRATVQLKQLKAGNLQQAIEEIAEIYINLMRDVYPELLKNHDLIIHILKNEVTKFGQTLDRGLKEFNKLSNIDGKVAFDLFQTYGFPLELTEELALEKGLKVDREEFKKEFEKHKELSRTASAGMFKGGLQDHSEVTTKYHTATHLLHTALRQVLGTHVQQKGSNITAQRLRFDFSHPDKLSDEQIKQVEDLVNEKIIEDLPVTCEQMPKDDALKSGALGFFTEKYADRVNVYSIGDYSKEICGGPHVEGTGVLGAFKVIKEESAGAGIRRIYATLS